MNAAMPKEKHVAVIGGGPAGLMAAEVLAKGGVKVDVFDAMPSVGRKFLLAGVGGMNITHAEPFADFVRRYGSRQAEVGRWLAGFRPDDLREWVHGLGIETFVGSSQRVFPRDMKAAPLLRVWLHRLRETGVTFHKRHRFCGWDEQQALRFNTPDGEIRHESAAVVLALGGASWPRLGSDGAWLPWLSAQGAGIVPLQPANCGFDVAWSPFLRGRFAGAPLKSVVATHVDVKGQTYRREGECVLSAEGIEGSLVYALSSALRDSIQANGEALLHLDLAPHRSETSLREALARPQGRNSQANRWRKAAGIEGVKAALLHEVLPRDALQDPSALAAAIKALPLRLLRPRPVAEAISTAGGVDLQSLTEDLMLKSRPGVFCAGEMLDWEAPTGGYLLTACFASGRVAGQGALQWLARRIAQ